MKSILLKSVLLIPFLLLSFALCDGLSFSDEKVANTPVVNTDFQKTSQQDDVISNGLPSLNLKGMIKSLVLVLILIAGFFVFLKWRYSGFRGIKGNKKHIQLIDQAMLGPKKNIYLVKILDRIIVVGTSNEGMYLLSEMDASDKDDLFEVEKESGGNFAKFIKSGLGNKKSDG